MRRLLPLLLLLPWSTSLAAGWETWTECRLVTVEYHDGDSFHVTNAGRDKIFRLYGADTPETSDEFPDRVKEQCKYFGVRKAAVLASAAQASDLSAQLLARPFKVETRWVDAKGSSRQARFYAKITLADGSDLATKLVEAGLARSYGMREGLAPSYLAQLERAEQTARRLRAGLWSGQAAAVKPVAPVPDTPAPKEELDLESQRIFDRLQQEGQRGAE